eukprot:XP_001691614.1 predicted protein [Chlamydomonas reinhardtii]
MPNMDENEFDAVVDVAAAACRGDMLQWLETHAGLYNAASRQGGDQWRHYINEELAAAAARSGHVSLLRLLLARLPQPSAGSGASRWSRLLRDVALGCPLPVPRRELAPASGGSCWSRDRRSRCGQDAVLEYLRGRGQVPSYSLDGRTLDRGAAPCARQATAPTSPRSATCMKSWARRCMQLRCIARAGSLEQLEWALGEWAPRLEPQRLLPAALAGGNLAAATLLHAVDSVTVLPRLDVLIGIWSECAGMFNAVHWYLQPRQQEVLMAAAGAASTAERFDAAIASDLEAANIVGSGVGWTLDTGAWMHGPSVALANAASPHAEAMC